MIYQRDITSLSSCSQIFVVHSNLLVCYIYIYIYININRTISLCYTKSIHLLLYYNRFLFLKERKLDTEWKFTHLHQERWSRRCLYTTRSESEGSPYASEFGFDDFPCVEIPVGPVGGRMKMELDPIEIGR